MRKSVGSQKLQSGTGTRLGVLACLLVLGIITAVIASPYLFSSSAAGGAGGRGSDDTTGGVEKTSSHDPRFPNYDIRTGKEEGTAEFFVNKRARASKSASDVADMRDEFVRGENELKARIPHAKVEYNDDIRIPEVITPDVMRSRIEFLTPPSTGKRSEILRDFLKDNSTLIGMRSSQLDALKVTADYKNPDGNISYAHLEQRINNIPVFRGEVKAGFTRDGRIIRVINNLAPGLENATVSQNFGDAGDAVRSAATNIDHALKGNLVVNEAASSADRVVFGDGDWATTAEKMYFPLEPGVAVPSWRVLIWQPVNAYYVIVDAESGTVLWRKNITQDQAQSATYQVYNSNGYVNVADSPAPLSPGPLDPTLGTQGVLGTRTNVTTVKGTGTSFNDNGWITDGGNTTDGNAVEAGIDRDGINGVDAAIVGSPNRVFSSTWNPPPGSPAPGDAPLTVEAQRGAVIQMFYAVNRYHDELYLRGFTEAALNFQANNFGRGGAGNDRVSAEGQDSASTNNANFATPADGGRGRMQMFIWTGPTPDYDGTADAEVVYHELTHGTSNRLHGNSSGLSTNMAGGMGEGWSDFYAEAMLSEPTDPVNAVYTTGGYATYLAQPGFTGNYYYGIRRFPRAPITFLGTNGRPHNPFTFRYVNVGCASLLDGSTSAFPRGPFGVAQCDAVHNLGEVWSSMLWEVRNRMVTRLGHGPGTTRVLQVVTDGMKLSPLNPNMLQSRDAIIAAAAALALTEAPEAVADVSDVREGFRVRGMGASASIQSISPAAVTEGFDVPNVVFTTPITVSDSSGDNDGFPEPGENLLITVPIVNNTGGGTVTNVNGSITGGGTASYGNIADGATVTRQITYTVPGGAVCGSQHTVNITGTSDLGAMNPTSVTFSLGVPTGLVAENFDGVVAPALPAGWTTANAGAGPPALWVTTATTPDTAPNSAFTNNPATIGESSIVTPVIPITSAAASANFRLRYNTESTFDGAVLEIKIGAGAFTDIVTAGGSFGANGYNGTLSNSFSNPLGGRSAWTGNSGAYLPVSVNLPAAANGQNIQLRWRMGSDISVSATGVNLDSFTLVSGYTCSLGGTPTPTGTPTATPTSTPTSTPTATPTGTPACTPAVPVSVAGTGTGAIPDGLTGTPPQFGTPQVISFNVAGVTAPLTNITNSITLTHTWSGDVDMVLTSPGGVASLVTVSRIGVTTAGSFGDSSNYSGAYVFSDAAASTNIWTLATAGGCGDLCNIAADTYRTTGAGQTGQTNPPPVTSLMTAFSGLSTAQLNGTWTLTIRDAANVDTGTTTAANLTLTGTAACGTPTPTSTPTAAPTATPACTPTQLYTNGPLVTHPGG
nr:M36 family metallopeptidase [Pyrinomonadaceae bacterium]